MSPHQAVTELRYGTSLQRPFKYLPKEYSLVAEEGLSSMD